MALVCTLASSSGGNSVLVSDGKTHILVDAGLPARRIKDKLSRFDLSVDDISAVLVTHEHSDHISGLAALRLPVYAAEGTCRAISGLARATPVFGAFEIAGIGVAPFFTPHDTPQSLGYLFHIGSLRVAVCTDLGHMPSEVLNVLCSSHYLMLEANYDVDMLRSGRYPAFLKDRILGRHGHLSNDEAAAAAAKCALSGTRRITLCHISKDNNSPDLAMGTVAYALHTAGLRLQQDVCVDAAPRADCGEPFYG